MKLPVFLFLFLFCLFRLPAVNGQTNPERLLSIEDTARQDEPEYELIVIEPGYETYLIMQPPMEFYSENYYKIWNQRYATEWNIRYLSGPRSELFENEIFYDPMTQYGIELEYRLYYFFRFFEKKYKITLVNRGR